MTKLHDPHFREYKEELRTEIVNAVIQFKSKQRAHKEQYGERLYGEIREFLKTKFGFTFSSISKANDFLKTVARYAREKNITSPLQIDTGKSSGKRTNRDLSVAIFRKNGVKVNDYRRLKGLK